jgi:ubiquitin C-terminal hydrolase
MKDEPAKVLNQPLSFTFGTAEVHTPEVADDSPLGLPRPVGLVNKGTTCYLNAALQCLCRIAVLSHYMLSDECGTLLNSINGGSACGLIAKEYRRFLEGACSANAGMRDPSVLRRAIGSRYSQFNTSEQHDAQEVLCAILDGLHEDLARPNTPNDGLTPRSRLSRRRGPTKPPSVIGDFFYGSLLTTLQCPVCRHCEPGYDPFVCLSLSLPSSNASVALIDCLHRFLCTETLSPTEMWLCPACAERVCATKRTVIRQAPKVLILHLKRFTTSNGTQTKITRTVDYPMELDVSAFSATPVDRYKLVGVIMHSGTIAFGHYTAAALDPATDNWYMFNDSYVTGTSEQFVRSSRAYVLIYQAATLRTPT